MNLREELLRAGLPEDAEAIVFSVADVWKPPAGSVETSLPPELNDVAMKAKNLAEEAISAAKKIADSDAAKLKSLFPSWMIKSEAVADSPAWGIISRAERWGADLVLVGSHGLSAFGKLIQGSVSEKVVAHSHRTVRVGRSLPKMGRKQIRLLAGVDGSDSSIAAIDHILERTWPEDTQIQVISVLDHRLSTAAISYLPHAASWIEEGYTDEEHWIRSIVEKQVEKLRNAGLNVSSSIVEGEPKFVLIEYANKWEADCIFVGARGLTRIERFLLGSVSGSVASRAHCSVEIVRR